MTSETTAATFHGRGDTEAVAQAVRRLERRFRGNPDVVRVLVACLLARRHVLLIGAPGTGKSFAATAAAETFGDTHRRVHVTAELWPSDLTGQAMWNPSRCEFDFHPGPLFADVVVLDELNRVPPRTQAALLEAMADGVVSVLDSSHALPIGMVVVATQNADRADLYPLDPALADRFAACVNVGPLVGAAEIEFVELALRADGAQSAFGKLELSANPELSISGRLALVSRVTLSRPVLEYAAALIAHVRSHAECPPSTRAFLDLGHLIRAWALVMGRQFVTPDDVKFMLPIVLGHRVDSREAVYAALSAVPVPRTLS